MNDQLGEEGVQDALKTILSVIKKEFDAMPEGDEMFEKLSQRLQSTYQSPPVQDFEFFVMKRFSDDEVRITLFQPLPEQVVYYVKGLMAGLNVPKDHSLKKTSSLLLTLMYLVHRKSVDFFKEFVLADGIEALIGYIDSDNLYERSQAMEILISFTDCEFFDWFSPPLLHQDQQIHLKMISILTGVDERNENALIQRLLKNQSNSYPGGSLRALQLLAFWLSWIRALYTKDQRLVLSTGLLQAVHNWSKASGEERDEDEKKLAETLYEDFAQKQFENLSTIPSSSASEGLQISGIQTPSFSSPETALSVNTTDIAVEDRRHDKTSDSVSTPTFEVTPTIEVISRYKAEGNDFYKTGKYDSALKSYQHAMNMILLLERRSIPPTTEQTELVALKITLHMNLANTIWKQWTATETETAENPLDAAEGVRETTTTSSSPQTATSSTEYFEVIKLHCDKILQEEPQHVKAKYRLISAYLQRQEVKTAYQLIRSFLDSRKEATTAITAAEDRQLFERLKRKCLAMQLYQLSQAEENQAVFSFEEWGLSSTDLILLKALLKRFQVSEKVISKLQIPEGESSSVGKAATRKKRPPSQKEDDDVEDDQSFLTNQDLIQDLSQQKATEKKKSMKPQVKLSKAKSADRKLMMQLKHQAKTVKAKMESNPSIGKEELETLLKPGFETMKELWNHDFKLKDIYGSLLEEEDLLFILRLLATAATPPTVSIPGVLPSVALSYQEWIAGSEVLKIIEQIMKCERIQSILFLMKHEYQGLFDQLKRVFHQLMTEEQNGTIKGNEKLLQQFLSLIS